MDGRDVTGAVDAAGFGGASAKLAPPLAVSSITLAGVELSQWVLILTIAYTLLQIVVVLRKNFGADWRRWKREWRVRRNKRRHDGHVNKRG